jgi:hypothetical protein
VKPLTAIAVTAALVLGCAAPALAAEDPERNATAPTSWHWAAGKTAAELDEIEEENGERVISINVANKIGTRFTAALVRNSGVYERDGDWFRGMTRDEVVALTKGQDRRLVDLEPYSLGFGGTRFAGVTVPNSGSSAKGWWWNYDLTPAQVTMDINKHKIRLVDLSFYVKAGKRRYAYVGIKNRGADQRAWWWYYRKSKAEVRALLNKNKARLVDVEREGATRLTVVMVEKEGKFSLPINNVTGKKLEELVQSNGVRITDIEPDGLKFWASTIDNVGSETGRVRSIIRSGPYRDSYFGAFSKQVAGPTHVGLAHEAPYQPMSVLKLVPHLYVMDRYDQGTWSLDTMRVYWKSPEGSPDTVACPGTPGKLKTYSDTLRNTLRRGLGESLGRAHETLLNTYKPEKITARMHELGLERTDIYYGCQHPGKNNWLSNRSTLTEMGELFEGVDTRQFFPNKWPTTRNEFYGLVADWPTDWLRPVVEQEAALQGKSGKVGDFMSRVTFDAKGGGVDNGSDADGWVSGRALSYRITLPFRKSAPVRRGGSPYEARSFVGGFFANGIPGPCHEGTANEDPNGVSEECRNWAAGMGMTFRGLPGELQRTSIRQALATW